MSKDNIDLERSTSQNIIGLLSSKAESSGLSGYIKSLWGWKKEQPTALSTARDTITERDFSGYLTSVAEGIGELKKTMNNKGRRRPREQPKNAEQSTSHIPRPFFSENYGLYLGKLTSKAEVKREQERLNDYLDTVEVCLFRQINTRFADFFNMLQNIEYLEKAVAVNISILSQARTSIRRIKDKCADRIVSIQRKQLSADNRRKILQVLKLLRQIKGSERADGDMGRFNETFKSIRELPSLTQAIAQLTQKAGKAGQTLAESIFGRVVRYINVPLSADLQRTMREIPGATATDNEQFINETVLLGESRIDAPAPKPSLRNEPASQKQLGRILEQVSNSIEVSEVAAEWKTFITELDLHHKAFRGQLCLVLNEAVRQQQNKKSILSELESTSSRSQECLQPTLLCEEAAGKVSMAYYSRLVDCYLQCVKSLLSRQVGLLSQFMSEIYRMGINEPELFVELMRFLQALLDFFLDRTFSMLAIKQLPCNCELAEFHSYIAPLLFWEEALQVLLQAKLFSLDFCHASEPIERSREHFTACLANIRALKQQRQAKYLQRIHRIIVNEELRQSLKDETWVAANNIPFNYMPVIYYVLYGENREQIQSSVLNQSLFGDTRNRREMSILALNRKRADVASYRGVDFKLLKNAIIVEKKHYRVSISFLTFVEILEEYLKIQDLYPELKEAVLTKIAEVVEVYSSVSYDMVVCGGALKLDKIKAKIITARHLCLSWSCLRLASVFLISLSGDRITQAKQALAEHSSEITKRLSRLIRGKTNQELTSLLKVQTLEQSCPMPQTLSIVGAYRQMFEILQDHMGEETIREVMQDTFDLLSGGFISGMKKKRQRGWEQIRYFLSEMKVLELGFKKEYAQLLRSIPEPEEIAAFSGGQSTPTDQPPKDPTLDGAEVCPQHEPATK